MLIISDRFAKANQVRCRNEMKSPWTIEELDGLKRRLEKSINGMEKAEPGLRGLPPMAEDEVREMLLAFLETAATRPLTRDEASLCGQLLCQFRMAVQAQILGRKGRYYVFSEDQINKLMGQPLAAGEQEEENGAHPQADR
jgi:hypothetical protein